MELQRGYHVVAVAPFPNDHVEVSMPAIQPSGMLSIQLSKNK